MWEPCTTSFINDQLREKSKIKTVVLPSANNNYIYNGYNSFSPTTFKTYVVYI